MATASKYASSNAVVTTGWTSPTNAYADDTSFATAAPAKNTSITSDFGFASFTTGDIPDGSVINSVTLTFLYKSSTTGSTGAGIGLACYANGSIVGTESTYAMATGDTTQSKAYSAIPALADLRTAGFHEARIRGFRAASNTAVTWSLDYAQITVDYSLNTQVDPTAASLTLTGATPSIVMPVLAVPTAAGLTLTGAVPDVAVGVAGVTVLPSAASLTLTGAVPAVVTNASIQPTAASLVLTGSVPAGGVIVTAQPTAASLTLTGSTPAIVLPILSQPASAALTIAGAVPTVAAGGTQSRQPSPASMTLAGAVPSVSAGSAITSQPTAASLTFTGAVPLIVLASQVFVGGKPPKIFHVAPIR